MIDSDYVIRLLYGTWFPGPATDPVISEVIDPSPRVSLLIDPASLILFFFWIDHQKSSSSRSDTRIVHRIVYHPRPGRAGRTCIQTSHHMSLSRIALRTITSPRLLTHRTLSRTTFRQINNMSDQQQQQQEPPAAAAQGQGWIWNKLGYEDLPQDVKTKGFYDLEAELPGGKSLKMVSLGGERKGTRQGFRIRR